MDAAIGSDTTSTRRARWIWVAALSLLLAACGGGGGGDGDGGSVDLPDTLVVNAPTTQQALGSAVAFSANASDPSFTYLWDFGDGSTSTAAAPEHSYARAGVFDVRLVVGNGDGGARTTTISLAVADFAIVAGKSCSGVANSGWCWQRPLPQGNAINDYTFVDNTRGWAVGEGGTVLATVDGGVSWTSQLSGTQATLGQVSFATPLIGWVAGSFGELLKTADGGASWQRVSYGQTEQLRAVKAIDANTASVTTYFGNTFLTSNGGTSWRQVIAPGAYSVVVVGIGDMWAVPYASGTPPSLLHSIDGGTTWVPVALPAVEPGLYFSYSALQFFDASHGLLTGQEYGFPVADPFNYVSRQTVKITSDGGVSWQTVALPPTGGYGDSYSLVEGGTLFAFSQGSYGAPAYKTVDKGMNWQAVTFPAGSYPTSFRAFSAQRLLFFESYRQAYLSLDGGATWSLRSAVGEAAASVSSIWFFDSREGIATGADGTSLRSSDGGQTWTSSGTPGLGWRRLQFLADASVGWVISDSGAIYRSTDKGRTWLAPVAQSSASLYGVTDFHFIDAQRGWAISPYSNGGGTVFRTTDGGTSWEAMTGTTSINGFRSLRFADPLNGVAVGPSGVVLVTSDGGVNWTPRPTGLGFDLRRVTFVDANTAVAVGDNGSIVRSTDRGQTWQPAASPTYRNLADVRFVSASVGHAVGDGGTQLVTHDGGANWASVATPAQAYLESVFFLDEQTGWMTGSNGAILATATGGR